MKIGYNKIDGVSYMTIKQKEILDEVVFSMEVEGFYIPEKERQTLSEILEGKRTYQDVLADYITEAKTYAGV